MTFVLFSITSAEARQHGGPIYGTSSAALGLEVGVDVQEYNVNLDTYAGITPSADVITLLGSTDDADIMINIGIVIGTNIQAWDNDLDTYAGITPSADIITLLGSADDATIRTNIGLIIGTDVQAYHAALASIAGRTETNGGILYGTADDTYAWLAAGAEGTLLMGNGVGAPSWLGAGTANSILQANGDADPTWVSSINLAFRGATAEVLLRDSDGGTTAEEDAGSIKANMSTATVDGEISDMYFTAFGGGTAGTEYGWMFWDSSDCSLLTGLMTDATAPALTRLG